MNSYLGTLTFTQWSLESKIHGKFACDIYFTQLTIMITKFCSLAALTKTENIADLTFQNLDTSCLIILRSKANSVRSIDERGLVIEDVNSDSFEIIGSGNAPGNFTLIFDS